MRCQAGGLYNGFIDNQTAPAIIPAPDAGKLTKTARYAASAGLSGNPRSVKDKLDHYSAVIRLRYFRTLSADEALRVQEGVDFAL